MSQFNHEPFPIPPTAGLFNNARIRRLAGWWLAANSVGVATSMFIWRVSYYQAVRAHTYNAPDLAQEIKFIFLLLPFTIVLGGLQVLTCCWIGSRVTVRSKTIQVTLGIVLGILTGFGISFLGVPIFWVYAFIGVWAFVLSGIVFGSLVGHAQWRAVAK